LRITINYIIDVLIQFWPKILDTSLTMGEFVYAVTAAENIILSSLFIGRKQR